MKYVAFYILGDNQYDVTFSSNIETLKARECAGMEIFESKGTKRNLYDKNLALEFLDLLRETKILEYSEGKTPSYK